MSKPFSEKELDDKAAEMVAVMSKALEGALRASTNGGVALAGLLLAATGLRRVLETDKRVPAEDLDKVDEWARIALAADPDLGFSMAQLEIERRETVAVIPNRQEAERIMAAASACLTAVRENSATVIDGLLILHVARETELAFLRHEHPNDYADQLDELRARENAFESENVHVVPAVTLSKGGTA